MLVGDDMEEQVEVDRPEISVDSASPVDSKDSESPIRFGAEFGPYRSSKSSGVSLSTFRTLVWTSNIGGLLLVAIGLELLITRNAFGWALACFIAGVAVALFPSNYEIVGMDQAPSTGDPSSTDEESIG